MFKLILISVFNIYTLDAAITKLTWEDCVKEVEKVNPDIKASQENLFSADFLRKASFGSFLPQISASIAYTQGYVFNTSGVTSTLYSASINASQNLFSGFQDTARYNKARSNKEYSAISLEITKAKLSYELKSAFAGLKYAQDAVKLTEDIIKRRSDNLRMVELRFDSGGENRGSLLLSKAYLTQAEYENLQAQKNVEIYREQIIRLLGLTISDEIEVTGEIPETRYDEKPDFKSMSKQTPDYRQAVTQREIAQADLTVSRSQFYPSLNLTGSYGKQGNTFFPQNERWNIGLTLSIPLFSGGKDYYTLLSSSSLLNQATLNIETLNRQLDTKLRQAYINYILAAKKLEADNDMLKATTTRAEIARNKYNNGLLTFENWDIIENDLISRQKTVIQSYRDKVTASAQWEQVQGKGIF